MNELNQWIRESRIKKGLDLRQLAQLCGITFGQIGRIENGYSNLTLNAIVRIAYGLNKTLADILFELKIPNPISSSNSSVLHQENNPFFTISDIEGSIKLFQIDKNQILYLLSKGYSNVLYRRSIQRNYVEVNPRETIQKIFETNQRNLLPYPSEINANHIEAIYFNSGVITIRDLGAYIKLSRNYSGLSMRKLGEQANFSYNTIFHLEKNGITKILMSDIIAMDKSLNMDGKLISISWAAGEYLTGIMRCRYKNSSQSVNFVIPSGWTDEELTIAESFLLLNRWSMVLSPEQLDWTFEVKDTLEHLI